jgi:hypothetical protein
MDDTKTIKAIDKEGAVRVLTYDDVLQASRVVQMMAGVAMSRGSKGIAAEWDEAANAVLASFKTYATGGE